MKYAICSRMNPVRPDLPFDFENSPLKIVMDARRDEHYAFAIVFTGASGDVRLDYSGFHEVVPAENFSCLNLGGIDYRGNPLGKKINAEADKQYTLWITARIPASLPDGSYEGSVGLICGEERVDIPAELIVSGDCVEHGFGEPEKMTRLEWFNSRLAQDGGVTRPFITPVWHGRVLSILGRDIEVSECGLPGSITTHFNKNVRICDKTGVITDGADIVITFADGEIRRLSKDFRVIESEVSSDDNGGVWKVVSECGELSCEIIGHAEFDGFISVVPKLTAKKRLEIADISVEYTVKKPFDRFSMGLGLRGGDCPERHDFKWDVELHQNSIWNGFVNGGIRCEFKGENFVEPFVNIYYRHRKLHMPESFANPTENGNLGGVTLIRDDEGAHIRAYSGERVMEEGKCLDYGFDFLVTPFKPLDMRARFRTRYYHGSAPKTETAVKYGLTHMIVHHDEEENPYINYPFITDDKLIPYIEGAHEKGVGVKLYYTMREQSDHTCEMNAMMSLGDEIIAPPIGGQMSCLWDEKSIKEFKDRYGEGCIPAWRTPHDMAIITDGQSRHCNYYIEGLDRLCKYYHIDGLYLDDISYDRITMRRARRVLDSEPRGDGEGCNGPRLIDLHSWEHYDPRAGFANSLNVYMPLMPYMDSVWIGEGFHHIREKADFWITEIMGLPFGLPGELLMNDKDSWSTGRYRGMLFGATTRFPWAGDSPEGLFEFFREYDIENTTLYGFWSEEELPGSTGDDGIMMSVFAGGKYTILALASWTDKPVTVTPKLDLPGFDLKNAFIPEVRIFQDAQEWNGSVTINPASGVLIVVPRSED